MIDLDELERVARGATPGPWTVDIDIFVEVDGYQACISDPGVTMLAKLAIGVDLHWGATEEWTSADNEERDRRFEQAKQSHAMRDASFIAAANPTVVLDLIAMAREEALAKQEVSMQLGDALGELRLAQGDLEALTRTHDRSSREVAALRVVEMHVRELLRDEPRKSELLRDALVDLDNARALP